MICSTFLRGFAPFFSLYLPHIKTPPFTQPSRKGAFCHGETEKTGAGRQLSGGAFAVTAGFAVQGHARAAQYRRMLDNTYQHAFTELATAAGELDVALRKVTYAHQSRAVLRTVRPAYSKALAAFYAVERQKKKRYAEYRIGKLYAAGLGCEQDYGDAARWFQLSADKGYKYAQYSLAGLFRRGQGVEQDDARALELYTAPHSRTSPMPPTS